MPLQYDPEYFKAFEPLIPLMSKRTKLAIKDIASSREIREAGIAALFGKLPDSPDVEQTLYHAEAADGYQIPILSFAKKIARSEPGPAIIHYHGGGMILGSAQLYVKPLAQLVSETSIPIFSVNYRLAPEHTGTTLVKDCYAALVWLHQNAQKHAIDPTRIAVYGDSAGGGLAVGVALMARDENLQPPLAKQILFFPMLDDRNMTPDEDMEPFAFFKTQDNVVAWTALLGDQAGRPDADISPYAAPARAKNLAGLPPTYIDVGTLDIFRNEDMAFASRLLAENITTEFHLYPGLPHAFDLIAPNISASKRAYQNRVGAMLTF